MRDTESTTIGTLALYGLLKCGTTIRFRRKKYKFVSFTYDYINNCEKILYVMFDIDRGSYSVFEEQDIKNEKVKLIEQNNGTKAEI